MKFKSNQGFSLIELMVVVAIIGILSVVGVPKYQVFKAKAIVAEAKSTLTDIFTVQQAYFMDNDTYSTTLATVGYSVATNAKYSYVAAAPSGGSINSGFVITATYPKTGTQKLCSGATNTSDVRTVNQDKTFATTTDGLAGC